MSKTFPEINDLNMRQLKAAIAIGETNLQALVGMARLDLVQRLNAMYDRKRRLYHVEQENKQLTAILARKGRG